MATNAESLPEEENPKKRARENSEKLIDGMEEIQKLCKRICSFNPNRESNLDQRERNQSLGLSLASVMPTLMEQITFLQTEVEELKAEKTASVMPKLLEQITLLQTEVEDLKTQNLTLKTEVADLKKEALNQQMHEVEDLKSENIELKSEVSELKKEVLHQQIHKTQKSVIIRALPQKNPGKESPLELRNQFEEVLKELKISQSVKISDIYRLKANENIAKKAKSEFLPTKVEFSTRFEKGLFFSKLKDLKAFKDIRVSTDVPKMLLEQYKELDRRGYEIRMAEPETNYRISLKGQNLSLFIKKQNEKKFQEVEFN